MSSSIVKVDRFDGGLNLGEPTIIKDNELSIATNVYYDSQKVLSTRQGVRNFGDAIAGETSIHSIYYTRFEDGTRVLLAGASTKVYRYNVSTGAWAEIDSGLTTGLPLSFVTYKDIVYWTNGTDNVRSYDGTTVTQRAAMPKGKYIVVQNDVGYIAGVSTDPSVVFYTAANPSTLHADAWDDDEPINQDEGYITGLGVLGTAVIVGKTKGVYTLNVFSSPVSIQAVDFDGDLSSHRSLVNVENDLLLASKNGFYSLSQRSGTTGSYRAYDWSEPISKLYNAITDRDSINSFYYKKTNNLYVSANVGDGSVNDTLLVYSVLTSVPGQYKFVWTKYENINANGFAEYIDADGVGHLLIANASDGQVIEIETGWNDNGIEIRSSIQTKTWDMGMPETWKSFGSVDTGGLISEQCTVAVVLDVDGIETSKSFSGNVFVSGDDSSDNPLGEEPLGEEPIGGGTIADDGLTFYPFIVRRPFLTSGLRMKVRIDSNNLNAGMKLTKLNIPIEAHDMSVFPNDYIIT